MTLSFVLTGLGTASIDDVAVTARPANRATPARDGHRVHHLSRCPVVRTPQPAIMASCRVANRRVHRLRFSSPMPRTSAQLRADVERIWWAGVQAVLPDRLIPEHVQVEGDTLLVGDEEIDLRHVRQIAVVGAGKASAGMAIALERRARPAIARR